jgi:hypothetical protein
VILASVGLCMPAMAQQQDFRPPSATEVSNLRSKCAEVGEKMLGGGNTEVLTKSQRSRYDPRTNRCYVELIVQTANPTKPPNFFHRFLFDGQTKEMLAEASSYNDNKEGQILDKQHIRNNSNNNGWNDAGEYIDQIMAEDRK